MGKIKRKQRITTYGSPLTSQSSYSANGGCGSVGTTNAFSSSSCSSASSSPSPPSWPSSSTASSVAATAFAIDEDAHLGPAEIISYTPAKLARFNQPRTQPQPPTQSPMTTRNQMSTLYCHNGGGVVKSHFTKKATVLPSGAVGQGGFLTHSHSLSNATPQQPPPVNALRARNSAPPTTSVMLNRRTTSTATNGISNRLIPNTYPARSKNGKYELKILAQPEEQHRARYLTEGSRGAIKDRSGHGYPVVKLSGPVKQPVKIQCFIGHDRQIGTPHLFYQASKIAGKNSTSCTVKRTEGTSVITMDASPSNNMEVIVDCIGILKERNVDVEQKLNKYQRVGASSGSDNQTVANIKRSTRCRLVFRCEIPETNEILQTVSSPILCTQPLGTPEINKKSMNQCNMSGGEELFIIGKNFLKDAKVIFRNDKWYKTVEPNREYLKSTHLICKIPAYDAPVPKSRTLSGKSCPIVEVELMVKSGGKESDPHKFYYRLCRSTTPCGCSMIAITDVNQLNDDSDNSMFELMETTATTHHHHHQTASHQLDSRTDFSVPQFSFFRKLDRTKNIKNNDLIRTASMSHMSNNMLALVNSKSLDSIPTITSSATTTTMPPPQQPACAEVTRSVSSVLTTAEIQPSHLIPEAVVNETSSDYATPVTKPLIELSNSDNSNQAPSIFNTTCMITDSLNANSVLSNGSTPMGSMVSFGIKQEVDSGIIPCISTVSNDSSTGQRLANVAATTTSLSQTTNFITNNPLIVNSVNHSLDTTDTDKTFSLAFANSLVSQQTSDTTMMVTSTDSDPRPEQQQQPTMMNETNYIQQQPQTLAAMNSSQVSYAPIDHSEPLKGEIIDVSDENSRMMAEIALSEINSRLSISSISNDITNSRMMEGMSITQFAKQPSPEQAHLQSMVSPLMSNSSGTNPNTSPSAASSHSASSPLSTECVLLATNAFTLSPESKNSLSMTTNYAMINENSQKPLDNGLVTMATTDYLPATSMDTMLTTQPTLLGAISGSQVNNLNCQQQAPNTANQTGTPLDPFIMTTKSIIQQQQTNSVVDNRSQVDTVMTTTNVPNEVPTSFLTPMVTDNSRTLLSSQMVSLNGNGGNGSGGSEGTSIQLGQLNPSQAVPMLANGQATVASVATAAAAAAGMMSMNSITTNSQNDVIMTEPANILIAQSNPGSDGAGGSNSMDTSFQSTDTSGNNGLGQYNPSSKDLVSELQNDQQAKSIAYMTGCNMQMMMDHQSSDTGSGGGVQTVSSGQPPSGPPPPPSAAPSAPVAQPGQTVLANQMVAQTSNICTLSKLSEAELINFINPATFE